MTLSMVILFTNTNYWKQNQNKKQKKYNYLFSLPPQKS